MAKWPGSKLSSVLLGFYKQVCLNHCIIILLQFGNIGTKEFWPRINPEPAKFWSRAPKFPHCRKTQLPSSILPIGIYLNQATNNWMQQAGMFSLRFTRKKRRKKTIAVVFFSERPQFEGGGAAGAGPRHPPRQGRLER